MHVYKPHLLVLLLTIGLLNSNCTGPNSSVKSNVEVPAEHKPWARWWWMGNAVTEEGISSQLEAFSKAGLGGVNIVPIYGVEGAEDHFIPYLDSTWIHMLDHTLKEATRVNMGVDMTLGTGWPYGGPWVEEKFAATKYDPSEPQGLPTSQKVKRNAPGGDGLVIDHFNPAALDDFLQPFDNSFIQRKNNLPIRAFFNDSYEVYGANWTSDFYNQFEKRRGYSLKPFEELLFIENDDPRTPLITSDYHQTISDLLYDNYTIPLAKWTHQQGSRLRSEAHGSPGNLLDLYAAADIAETEIFRSSHFDIPGVRIDEGHDPKLDKPNILMMKFASSAAHLAGRSLVSSETATWLGNHFKVALSQVKPEVDQLFTAGINHIIYHGITYSPTDEAWPGWLFYASTHFGPTSHLWPHLQLLNKYITRCQTILQKSKPDNEVLVYFPIYDLWDEPGSIDHTHPLRVHNIDDWLLHRNVGTVSDYLQTNGYGFDFISDNLLKTLLEKGESEITYKVLVVPTSEYLPVQTLKNLILLSEKGIGILFLDQVPDKVPGLFENSERKDRLKHLTESLNFGRENNSEEIIRSSSHPIYICKNLQTGLDELELLPESIVTQGLSYIRKSQDETDIYFISNLKNNFEAGNITLNTSRKQLKIFDPLSGGTGSLKANQINKNQTNFYLELPPGQSCFIFADDEMTPETAWQYHIPKGKSMALDEGWSFSFGEGVPDIDGSSEMDPIGSWTELDIPGSKIFSGIGIYETTFELPDEVSNHDILLSLGQVREVAEVSINSNLIDTLWSVPYQLRIPGNLLRNTNNLTIKVTNLSANRIAHMDREKINWKKFYDINVVDISYKPFDAAQWAPVPSGLLGPISIQPISSEP